MGKQTEFESISTAHIDSLYKYKIFDKKCHYKDILRNILYFPSFSELNDPYDSQISTNYSLCTDNELDKYVRSLAPKSKFNKNPSEQQIQKAIQDLKNNDDSIKKRFETAAERRLGIFSLAQRRDNLLLWSHYANRHQGFCIEFDAKKLLAVIMKEVNENNEKAFLFKVNYQEAMPQINPCRMNFEKRMKLQFLTKSKAWKYEEEWRIVTLNGSKVKIEIPKELIKGVYFGALASKKNIKRAKKILKTFNPTINVYQAKKKTNEFGLEFEKIDLE